MEFTKAILLFTTKKEKLNNPKFSIITICFNAKDTIEQTIQSVLQQNYKNIEYIVIDGGSKDGSAEIIRKYSSQISHFVSEPDNGLYDALNKGFKAAAGDIIGILHADDYFAHSQVVDTLAHLFNTHQNIDCLSTSVEIYKHPNYSKPYRNYRATAFSTWQFRIGMQPPHPGFYIKKEAFNKVGFFNTNYKISGDFDWLLRVIIQHKMTVHYSNFVSVHMRHGGVSSAGFKSILLMNRENLKVLKNNGIYSNLPLIFTKYFFKIFQLI